MPALAHRLLGSPDIYGHEEREAEQSINFVTCHDGFTLNDLVSYNSKHNEANGEDNRDGADDNLSWNCGVEGPTDDPAIEALRNRQVKNFLALTLLAAGTPMLLMGDEVRRTQRGNNNAYCQDSEISWFDWSLLERHADIHRFVKTLNAFRQRRDVVVAGRRSASSISCARRGSSGAGGPRPPGLVRALALPGSHAAKPAGGYLFHCILNACWEPLTFALPPVPAAEPRTAFSPSAAASGRGRGRTDRETGAGVHFGGHGGQEARRLWRRCIDTAMPPPDASTHRGRPSSSSRAIQRSRAHWSFFAVGI